MINNLEINIKKTQIVIFRRGGNCHDNKLGPFLYGDKEKIDIVSRYNYLGVTFSNSATFFNAAEGAISRANMALGATVSLINRLNLKTLFFTFEKPC